ncbi:hypothetical protein SDC9_175910 [bioreactor metagenome]|uniref:Uncharacterized protein n=1 Tax=bioreactor metagenome TaxID=1076179 RepID=A0A645GNH2_9ZZZZ
MTEGRNAEHPAHLFKCNFRIFVFYPHCLGRINRRTSAHRDDPVWLKLKHGIRAAHNGFNGRVGLNAFENLDFHAGFFQISDGFIKKSELLH